ncbi:capsular polysaccharide biosynthesis protein [Campylobacter devanensis]|uniref:Uncharacterized protein n=1 Tax=Campylobacter devanensis TaxID=3161138 RepID=A0A1X9SQB1_9BACT|nr:hypothetical protein [Campylobacter lanienae]ARQ98437.1 hypothetical protein CIGN_0106 [Campylobacter lanienae]SUX01444.1 capsular polysaccharide biosynthesis protein [Campylobacter lanienae]
MAKVALCISGAFRGENFIEDIRNSINGIAEPLNADVFIASWDSYKVWMGLCGGSPGWLRILYSQNIIEAAPKEIVVVNAEFKDKCPNIYNALNREIDRPITSKILNKIQKLPNVKGVYLSNEREFLQKYPCKLDVATSLKMTYNYTRVAKLIQDYEEKHNFYYDYIIHIRPDFKYTLNFSIDTLKKLKDNQLYIAMHHSNSTSDMQFFGRRYAVLEFLSLFDKAKKYSHLPYFQAFKDGGVCCCYKLGGNGAYEGGIDHRVLYECVAFLGIEQIDSKTLLPYVRIKKNPIMPPLNEAIKKDKEHWKSIKLNDPSDFFKALTCKKILKSQNADERVRNQLSYKLGQAIIELPIYTLLFALLKIKRDHKIDEAIYRQSIQKYPNLKLPPLETYPDYNEAIKIKNHLSYKLGEALIKANNKGFITGGGGYWLLFEIRRIIKEHKKAKNENR